MSKATLTQSVLKELLRYDPETGFFRWRERDVNWFVDKPHCRSFNTRWAGKKAGVRATFNGYSRIEIGILGVKYKAHRLAFLYVYGRWPTEILHYDQDGTNNKLSNLSEGTHADNMRNLKKPITNTSGVMGVQSHGPCGRWRVRFRHNGRFVEGGRLFTSFREAVLRLSELRVQYGCHPNHGQEVA